MAWEARLGLKLSHLATFRGLLYRLNGLGSPSGIETFLVFRHSAFTDEG